MNQQLNYKCSKCANNVCEIGEMRVPADSGVKSLTFRAASILLLSVSAAAILSFSELTAAD